jgi:hypothetical protein
MSATRLEVVVSPAEFAALRERDLSQTVCVVFDILRASTSMITALGNGAEAIIPVAEISEALTIRKNRPDVLLAGERGGLRIRSDQANGVDFDLGNSPREFTAEKSSRPHDRHDDDQRHAGVARVRGSANSAGQFVPEFAGDLHVDHGPRSEQPSSWFAAGHLRSRRLERNPCGRGSV